MSKQEGTKDHPQNINEVKVKEVETEIEESKDPYSLLQKLILNVHNHDTRKDALINFFAYHPKSLPPSEIGHLLYYSEGTMAIFLQELVGAYPLLLSPFKMGIEDALRIMNVFYTIKLMGLHPLTRSKLLDMNIYTIIQPFLASKEERNPYEFVKWGGFAMMNRILASYGKKIDPLVVDSLMEIDFMETCLTAMNTPQRVPSKILASNLLQKLLETEQGLDYATEAFSRFEKIAFILAKLVIELKTGKPGPNQDLLRSVISCYLRLMQNQKGYEALTHCLPDELKDGTFDNVENNEEDKVVPIKNLLDKLKTLAFGNNKSKSNGNTC